jgi:hypothetical protein
MENLHIYRAMFGHSTATLEPNLHRSAAAPQQPASNADQ